MKLSEWARKNGLTYVTAYNLFRANKLPIKATQLKTGTILVENERDEKNVIYARVSSHDQKQDLERQLNRLRQYAYANNIALHNEYSEIGSGVNSNRKKLNSILRDNSVTTIIVEHRDRLTRFGFEMLEASLIASGRKIIVVEDKDVNDDLVQDIIDILTSFCAKIYGRRSAEKRVKRAIRELENEN